MYLNFLKHLNVVVFKKLILLGEYPTFILARRLDL